MSTIPRPDTTSLDRYLPLWGLPTSQERAMKRATSSLAEIEAFYDAMLPQLPGIIEYLNQYHPKEIPVGDQPMAHAALAMCEVDFAVNKWRAPNVDSGMNVACMPEKAGPYDRMRAS